MLTNLASSQKLTNKGKPNKKGNAITVMHALPLENSVPPAQRFTVYPQPLRHSRLDMDAGGSGAWPPQQQTGGQAVEEPADGAGELAGAGAQRSAR